MFRNKDYLQLYFSLSKSQFMIFKSAMSPFVLGLIAGSEPKWLT